MLVVFCRPTDLEEPVNLHNIFNTWDNILYAKCFPLKHQRQHKKKKIVKATTYSLASFIYYNNIKTTENMEAYSSILL